MRTRRVFVSFGVGARGPSPDFPSGVLLWRRGVRIDARPVPPKCGSFPVIDDRLFLSLSLSKRWYLLFENANELSDRVWMGTWRRHVCWYPSKRREHTVPGRASGGTAAKHVSRHRGEEKGRTTPPLIIRRRPPYFLERSGPGPGRPPQDVYQDSPDLPVPASDCA